MSKKALFITLAVVLIWSLSACGREEKSDDGTHGIGEAVQVDDVIITMNSASLVSYKVKAEFTVENKGTADLTLDPETSFVIEGDNTGTKVELTLDPVGCSNSLSGTVPAGGSLTGDLCWRSNPSDTWPTVAFISYGGDSMASAAAVWKVALEE